MPDELLMFVTKLNDEALLRLLAWVRQNPERAIEELEAVISRQAPTVRRKGER